MGAYLLPVCCRDGKFRSVHGCKDESWKWQGGAVARRSTKAKGDAYCEKEAGKGGKQHHRMKQSKVHFPPL